MVKIYVVDNRPSELMVEMCEMLHDEYPDFSRISPDAVFAEFRKHRSDCAFILSSFEGNVYDHLRDLDFIIFGPQIVLHYFSLGEVLPNVSRYSAALRGAIVTVSGLGKEERDHIKQLVELMDGEYSGSLTESVNVLVTRQIRSSKYNVCVERNVPILRPEWITFLWDKSFNTHPIYGMDSDIIKQYRLGIFASLQICVSGMSQQERTDAQLLIESHGGKYLPDLIAHDCTHLIVKEHSSEKLLYARKWEVSVVNTKWLSDSVEKGICLDELLYPYEPINFTSSFKEGIQSVGLDSFGSDICDSNVSRINETRLSYTTNQIFNNCNIFFEGSDCRFTIELFNEIQFHGGTVVDQLNIATHRIVGSGQRVVEHDSVKNVDFEWIEQCLKQKVLVPEDAFIVNINNKSSDTLAMFMDSESDPTITSEEPKTMEKPSEECEIVEEESTVIDDDGLFSGRTFAFCQEIHDNAERQAELSQLIEVNKGKILLNGSFSNNCILICDIIAKQWPPTCIPVTEYFIKRCIEEKSMFSVENDFLFQPILSSSIPTNLFNNCVFSFSGYVIGERTVLKAVCRAFGAIPQEQFSRRSIPDQKIRATTHLIIGQPDNKKLPRALKWKIPAVTRHWIEACLRSKKLVNTDEYSMQLDSDMSIRSVFSEVNMNESTVVHRVPHINSALPILPEFKLPLPKTFIEHRDFGNENTRLDESSGLLDSPIRPTLKMSAIDVNSLQQLAKTPENWKYKIQPKSVISTPEMSEALRACVIRMETSSVPRPTWLDESLSENIPTPKPILGGVVVYLSKSSGHLQTTLSDIIERFGGRISWIYDSTVVTHVVFDEESVTDRHKEEFERANKDGKLIVSVKWLLKCQDEYCRADESQYTYSGSFTESGKSCAAETVDHRKRKVSDETTVDDVPKAKVRLSADSVRTEQFEDMDTIDDQRKVIMFSIQDKSKTESYIEGVKRLGGTVELGDDYSSVTHLIVTMISRNEKFVSAVSSGKWILHESYLDSSFRAGKWLDEAEFEWGGHRLKDFLQMATGGSGVDNMGIKLAEAGRRLRESGGKAFSEWKVCLVEKEGRIDKLAKIIVTGGGKVLPINPLPDPSDVTHVLINPSLIGDLPDLSSFQCYQVELIPHFLLATSLAENKRIAKKFLIPPRSLGSKKVGIERRISRK